MSESSRKTARVPNLGREVRTIQSLSDLKEIQVDAGVVVAGVVDEKEVAGGSRSLSSPEKLDVAAPSDGVPGGEFAEWSKVLGYASSSTASEASSVD